MTLSSDLLAPTGWTLEVAAAGVFLAGAGPPGADVVRVAGAAAESPDDPRPSNSRRPIPGPVGSA